jgi:hypothetical protein
MGTNMAGWINKPPPDVGDRTRTTPQLVASMLQGAMVGSPPPEPPHNGRLGQIEKIFGKMDSYDKFRGSRESADHRVFIVDLWWAWVDLNHQPRPYQEGDLRNMFASRIKTWLLAAKAL